MNDSSQTDFWTDLIERGQVHDATDGVGEWIANELQNARDSGRPLYGYVGFDPTAESLHVGSLIPVLTLLRMKRAGFTPIALVGGATGMIGDPSGKQAERSLLDPETLERNVAGIASQLSRLLEGESGRDFLVVNNADWVGPVRLIDFLRDIGKHFSVNAMVRKDSVRSRLEERDQGISYTEFSYMLIQAFDFLYLYEKYGCRVQSGGSDQWGNITAGIDLIHRKHGQTAAHGWTCPLLTRSDGKKFGKSEGGNLWLDAGRTHPYFVYKYFFDTPDADAGKLLGTLTLLERLEIRELEKAAVEKPQERAAQKRLALELTAFLHGRRIALACEGLEAAMHVEDAAEFERHADILGLLTPPHEKAAAAELPVLHKPLSELAGPGLAVAELAVESALFSSKSDFRREIQSGGGFRLAGEPVSDPNMRLTTEWLGNRRVIALRKGRKNKRMVCFF